MTKTMTDDRLDANVMHFLSRHIGKENRIDRWELVERIFGAPVPAHLRNDDHPLDRQVRESVSRLRIAGHLICDMGDGSGKYIASTEDEFREFYAYFIKPIKHKARTAREMKKSAARKFPSLLQPSLFGAVLEDVEV